MAEHECPKCGMTIDGHADLGGEAIRCPRCGELFDVPAEEPALAEGASVAEDVSEQQPRLPASGPPPLPVRQVVRWWSELAKRVALAVLGLVVAMLVAMWFVQDIVEVLRGPYEQVAFEYRIDGSLIVTSPAAQSLVWFRVWLLGGVVLASPWMFYQMWLFIATGLGPDQRRDALRGAVCSTGLFLLGAAVFLYVIAYQMLAFFVWFGGQALDNVRPILELNQYLATMTTMMVVTGLIFQVPSTLFLMARMRGLTARRLGRCRLYVIGGALLVAAVATSPSPVDTVALALVLWGAYEAGVGLVRMRS